MSFQASYFANYTVIAIQIAIIVILIIDLHNSVMSDFAYFMLFTGHMGYLFLVELLTVSERNYSRRFSLADDSVAAKDIFTPCFHLVTLTRASWINAMCLLLSAGQFAVAISLYQSYIDRHQSLLCSFSLTTIALQINQQLFAAMGCNYCHFIHIGSEREPLMHDSQLTQEEGEHHIDNSRREEEEEEDNSSYVMPPPISSIVKNNKKTEQSNNDDFEVEIETGGRKIKNLFNGKIKKKYRL